MKRIEDTIEDVFKTLGSTFLSIVFVITTYNVWQDPNWLNQYQLIRIIPFEMWLSLSLMSVAVSEAIFIGTITKAVKQSGGAAYEIAK